MLRLPVQVPSHHLKELMIDADGLSLYLNASQLFSAAEAVQLRGAGTAQLRLPLPGRSRPWEQLVQRIQEAGGLAATPTLRAQQFAFALLEAFRLSGLHSAEVCAHSWALQLPILMDGSAAPAVVAAAGGQPTGVTLVLCPEVMQDAVNMAVNGALGQFGRLRTTDSKLVNGQLQLSLRRSRVGAAAIRTCGFLGGALRNLACAVCVLAALGSLTELARHINPALGRTIQVGATSAFSALSLALVDQDFRELLLLHHT